MMKKIYVSVLFLGSLLFAQDALREADNNADFDAVRQMVKKNEIEEVYEEKGIEVNIVFGKELPRTIAQKIKLST